MANSDLEVPSYDSATESWHGTLAWQPYSQKRPRISAAVAGKRRRTHRDPADVAAEKATRTTLIMLNLPVLPTNVWLRLIFYRASRQVVDGDNLEKHFLDAANGVLWVDDCQVTDKWSTIRLDRDRPRTEFWVGRDTESNMTRDYTHRVAQCVADNAAIREAQPE